MINKQNLMPQVAQPVNRTTTGLLSPELAELSEEALQQLHDSCGGDASAAVLASAVLASASPWYLRSGSQNLAV